MLLKGMFEVRGQEPKVSAKGSAYNLVALEQMADTIKIMTKVDMSQLKGKEVIATIEYNPQYKQLSLMSYELAK